MKFPGLATTAGIRQLAHLVETEYGRPLAAIYFVDRPSLYAAVERRLLLEAAECGLLPPHVFRGEQPGSVLVDGVQLRCFERRKASPMQWTAVPGCCMIPGLWLLRTDGRFVELRPIENSTEQLSLL